MNFRDKMPKYYLVASSIYGVLGMGLGAYMHMTSWKRPIPFHGHLDSLGLLTLAVVGLTMQVFPWARRHVLSPLLFVLLQVGTLLMLGGLPIAIFGLTHVLINVGAVMVPVGIVTFSLIMISGLKENYDE
ncbi:hypothetical protein [Novosphingobium sp.]|uniref:hypothetical protein n=1 Tax=Novosphingobium sp. TaxID=1874826 RepID=UPI00261F62BB|nr:hypothetical protein [Novosphingobium sp.]